MLNKTTLITAALGGLLALGAVTASAADDAATEKCYGVAKAGQNDCANLSGSHTCAGQAKVDKGVDEWVYVKGGTCKKMGGLTFEEATVAMKK